MTPKNWWCEKCFQIPSELATNGEKFTENAPARPLARCGNTVISTVAEYSVDIEYKLYLYV